MAANSSTERITLLSFRTFGDYVLKAPFLHELFAQHPNAEVTLLTNEKGGQVYPLLDSRLKIVVVDHGHSKAHVLRKLGRIPKADVVYAMDDSRTTLLLALIVRGRQKIGWIQGLSRLYAKDGFFEWKSVRPWLSKIMSLVFHPARVRLPEDSYEGDVELQLLDHRPSIDRNVAEPVLSLASYRSSFALPPAKRPETPYIYCAAEAGWLARQLTVDQWKGVVAGLLDAFPDHCIVVHGEAALKGVASGDRVIPYSKRSIKELFEEISAADLVIAPDSFALHLASLYDVPAIGYFGPAHPHRFRPTSPGSSSLFRQPECSPCLQKRGTIPCAKGLTQCISLAQLAPADFVAAARKALLSRSLPSNESYAHRRPDP
jgi:ADP-heptose:LPS heptosyltransferase